MLERIPLNYYAFSGLLNFFTSFILSIFVFLKNPKASINKIFAVFALFSSGWGLFYYLWLVTLDESSLAEFYLRTLMLFVIFVPAAFTHFILTLLKVKFKDRITVVNYSISILIGLSVYTQLFAKEVGPFLVFPFWLKVGPVFHFHLVHFLANIIYSHVLMFKSLKHNTGILRHQVLYIFIGTAIGYTAGVFNYLPWYRIPVPPFLNPLVAIYVAFVSYSIIKYHLLDIKLAITRATIFVSVYALVLGVPFYLYFLSHKLLALILMAVLATVGPYLYLFFQQKAEERILQEEIRTRALLTKASYGMATVRNLQRLLEIIVDILTKHLRLDNAAIYLNESDKNEYVLKVSKSEYKNHVIMSADDPLVERLRETKSPLIYEEIRMLSEGHTNRSEDFHEIAKQMKELSASVIVPAIAENTLLGFIVLGGRKDKGIYSPDLIDVLSVLGNQSALAIENCHYWEESKKRMLEEGFHQRLESLDAMASSFAHEVDNPLSIVIGELGCAEDIICDEKNDIPEDAVSELQKIFKFVVESSMRISKMMKSILEYSRMGTGETVSVSMYDVIEGFENLINPKFKSEGVRYQKDMKEGLPNVRGDKIQIEEILMNFAINAMHAFKNKEDKKIHLKIFKKNSEMVRIEFSDNGYGIEENILKDIFLASVTTKGSSEGTGLGLFRTRKIVDFHEGNLWAESAGKDKGATFIVELPVF